MKSSEVVFKLNLRWVKFVSCLVHTAALWKKDITKTTTLYILPWCVTVNYKLLPGEENMSSSKSLHYMTRSSLSSPLSNSGLLCDDQLGPEASFVLIPFMGSPICFLAVGIWELSFLQPLFLSQVWFVASLGSVLSYSSLSETPLYLLCDPHCYFWKTPNSQGALCFPSYAQGRTHQREAANPSVSQTTPPKRSHKTKGRIPLWPRGHPVPKGWAHWCHSRDLGFPDTPVASPTRVLKLLFRVKSSRLVFWLYCLGWGMVRPDAAQERETRMSLMVLSLAVPCENTAHHTGPLWGSTSVGHQEGGVGKAVVKSIYYGFHRKERVWQSARCRIG